MKLDLTFYSFNVKFADGGDVKHDTKRIDNGLRNVETDVAWIKGKLEGPQASISNKDAKSAIWIALGSAVVAIISLIKSFW